MEQYREKAKTARKIYIITVLVLAAFILLFLMSQAGVVNINPITGDSHWQSRWRGMVTGAAGGIIGSLLASIRRINKALRDEKELKKLYVEENDERQKQIWTSARALSMQIFLMGGLVAAIVAGYFNVTVSITILACVVIHSLLGAACKLYYSKKF